MKPSGRVYLWLAVVIFGSASALTRKISDIGAQSAIDGHNPISLCNILFVGNICALLVLLCLHRRDLNRRNLSQISKRQWLMLTIVSVLSGAVVPGLVFQALASTSVTNVLLVGRLEPPLTIAVSIWLLRERVNRWEIVGAIVAFVGVLVTIELQPMAMESGGNQLGWGEVLAALGAIVSTIATFLSKRGISTVPLSIFNIMRTGIGAIVFFGLAVVLYGSSHFMELSSPLLWQWMLAYGTIVVVVGQSAWSAGFRATSLATASTIASFAPIFGIAAAFLILGEVPTFTQYVGGAAIVFGLYLSRLGERSRGKLRGKSRQGDRRINAVAKVRAIEGQMGFKGL
jgi:drug/metabolite transporter (DMT)-like permease